MREIRYGPPPARFTTGNRTARRKLPVRRKPHDFTTIAPGMALGYRRTRAAGTWVVRVANGHGGIGGLAIVGDADSLRPIGEHALDWWQATDKARKLERGGRVPGHDGHGHP